MAHMIENDVTGKPMMAYAGEKPWHGLGKEVPPDLSTDQMLEAAGLDWEVHKVPAYAQVNNEKVSVGWSALVRDSDFHVLSTVSNDWKPTQNHEAFEFFREFVEAGDMQMHTAGSLQNGQIVWALAKINDGFSLFGGDDVESFLLFTNPHKFAQSIDIRFTPIRVVCNNTLTLSLNMKTKKDRVFKQSHRRMFDADIAKATLGIARDKMGKYKEMAAFLGAKRYTEDKLKQYMRGVFPVITQKEQSDKEFSKSASRALELVEVQPGSNFAPGSWWNAFNAVTYMTDHVVGKTTDSRLRSAWFGQNRGLKVRALESAVEFANAA